MIRIALIQQLYCNAAYGWLSLWRRFDKPWRRVLEVAMSDRLFIASTAFAYMAWFVIAICYAI